MRNVFSSEKGDLWKPKESSAKKKKEKKEKKKDKQMMRNGKKCVFVFCQSFVFQIFVWIHFLVEQKGAPEMKRQGDEK